MLLIKLFIGEAVANATQIGRCSLGDNINPWGAYGFETISTLFLLFIAFGTALDPRQREVYGPVLPPLMISCCIGKHIMSFIICSGLKIMTRVNNQRFDVLPS